MMNRKSFTAVIACLVVSFSLQGCKNEFKDWSWNVFEKQSLINKDIVIDKAKKRTKETAKYGPKSIKNDVKTKRLRKLINKEKKSSYAKLQAESKPFPVDINVENIDIRLFMKMIAEMADLNILVSDEVTGFVTAKLSNVPWTGALDSILNIKGLAKHVDNESNLIRIHSQQVVVELEDFERKRSEDLQKTAQLQRLSAPIYTEIFKLFYTKPEDIKLMIEQVLGVTGDSKNAAKITLNERNNSIIVKATKDDITLVQKLIDEVDSQTKQVFIEAFIVEVNDGFEKAIGTRLGIENSPSDNSDVDNNNITITGQGPIGGDIASFGVGAASSGIGILTGIGSTAELRFELTAMEQEGLTNVISNPRIFTLNNQEAKIFQGDEVPYETVSQDGTQVEFKEAGLRLAVTPTIVGDGNLTMDIKVNKDTVDTSQSNPPITKSEVETSLITQDGSIVVIGGIYTQTKTNSVDKTPLFGDIPVLGNLFKRQQKEDSKKELLIFIAPTVL